jgi:hypothetical protein
MFDITSLRRSVSASIPFTFLAVYLALAGTTCRAQTGSVPVPMRSRSSVRHVQRAAMSKTKLSKSPDITRSTLQAAAACSADVDFGKVAYGQVGLKICSVPITASNPIVSIDIRDSNKDDPSQLFKAEKNLEPLANPVVQKAGQEKQETKEGQRNGLPDSCRSDTADVPAGSCVLAVGFGSRDDHSSLTATVTIQFRDETRLTFTLKGQGDTALGCVQPYIFLPLSRGFKAGDLYPVTPAGITDELALVIYKDLGDPFAKV